MLRIKDLSVSYGENLIINHMNGVFRPGTISVITGLSGCGKTTLLKVLNGIIPEVNEAEVHGSVTFGEHDLLNEDMPSKSSYLSTVFQNPKTQFYCINSDDELAFGLENRNVPREEILSTISKYTKLLKTEDLTGRDVFSLSGGEKQLLAITATACLDNDIYLFDEPSASLDRSAIRRFKEVLLQLKKQKKIILIAEHRLYYLKELLDSLLVLDHGQIYDYTPSQLKADYPSIQKKHNLREINEIKYEDFNKEKITRVKLTGEQGIQNKAEGDKVLRCSGFKAAYQQPVLDLSIDLKPGIYFIIGENGVGKSTFIKRLCNLNKGRGTRYYDKVKFTRPYKYVSMVMQDVNYQIFTESCFNELNVIQPDEEAIDQALKEVGLLHKKEVHPQLLSGGEKQRLLIAKTKVSNKPVILLDEPTSGLDRLQMKRIASYLHEFKNMGKTVLVITHDYELISECDGEILEFIKE